ncbi:hypothetical protein [Embleya sp. NPDC059259]|uniref:hypothetical protein n=1 Tax=unclassified Embleya TaxID=2699296 RepID=UPI0036AD4912
MRRARRAAASLALWVTTTTIVTALAWWGVRAVLRDTVFERPPFPAAPQHSPSAQARPQSSESPAAPTPAGKKVVAAPPPASTRPPSKSPTPKKSPADANTTPGTYQVLGGRASFEIGATSASLIAATPAPNWAAKVWNSAEWIRVDFTKDGHTSSIFVTWNDHPPVVSTHEE